MVWDVTCPDTLAPSHITLAASEAGAVASDAERMEYSHLDRSLLFVPIAIESLGVLESEAKRFLRELYANAEAVTNEPLYTSFFYRGLQLQCSMGMLQESWVLLASGILHSFAFVFGFCLCGFFCNV